MNDLVTTATTPKPKPKTPATRVRQSVKSSLDRSRDSVEQGVTVLRTKAGDAIEAGVNAVDQSPLTAIAGAIAVGAALGALIPATSQEEKAIGPFGDRIRDALDSSFAAAKSAGAEQLSAKGLTSAALSSGLSGIVVSIIQAALAGSKAARASTAEW